MLVAIDRNPLCACKSIFKSPAFNVRVRVQGASAGSLGGSPPSLLEDDPGYTTCADGQGKARTHTHSHTHTNKTPQTNDGEVEKEGWDAEKDMQPKAGVSIRWGCVGWACDISPRLLVALLPVDIWLCHDPALMAAPLGETEVCRRAATSFNRLVAPESNRPK